MLERFKQLLGEMNRGIYEKDETYLTYGGYGAVG